MPGKLFRVAKKIYFLEILNMSVNSLFDGL